MQFMGFGDGHHGAVEASGDWSSSYYASMTGTAGTTTVTTALGCVAGDIIMLHQTYGTGAGNWELVKVVSTGAGSFTCSPSLVNTYVTGAQAVLCLQRTFGTLSGTTYCSAWDGTKGGILAYLVSGVMTVSGTLSVVSRGFVGRGTNTDKTDVPPHIVKAQQGEGTGGAGGTLDTTANGNGGGGGWNQITQYGGSGGAGGGNGSAGSNGQTTSEGIPGGTGGIEVGSADLTTMCFGGAGGQGRAAYYGTSMGGASGSGGGIIFICSKKIIISGTINASGSAGSNGTTGSPDYGGGGGGGGAGGSILIKSQNITLGSGLITSIGASGGSKTPSGNAGDGGTGANGRIRIEACYMTGTTNPTMSSVHGGNAWCASDVGGII